MHPNNLGKKQHFELYLESCNQCSPYRIGATLLKQLQPAGLGSAAGCRAQLLKVRGLTEGGSWRLFHRCILCASCCTHFWILILWLPQVWTIAMYSVWHCSWSSLTSCSCQECSGMDSSLNPFSPKDFDYAGWQAPLRNFLYHRVCCFPPPPPPSPPHYGVR